MIIVVMLAAMLSLNTISESFFTYLRAKKIAKGSNGKHYFLWFVQAVNFIDI